MSEATTIELRQTRMEVQLTDEAERRAGTDDVDVGENDENRWMPVLATYIQDKKLHLVVATPWVAESSEDEGKNTDEWFLPFIVTDKDVYASRFKAFNHKND